MEQKIKYARVCDECGNGMNEGYVIEAGEAYYCTDKCLHAHYTSEQWNELSERDDDEYYWTQWDNYDE